MQEVCLAVILELDLLKIGSTPLKFNILQILTLMAAFCLMFAVARWNVVLAAMISPLTFGFCAAHASSPNPPAWFHGIWFAICWTAFSLFLAAPFVIIYYYANLELVGNSLLLFVAFCTSVFAGFRGAKLSDRNKEFRENFNSYG